MIYAAYQIEIDKDINRVYTKKPFTKENIDTLIIISEFVLFKKNKK